MSLEVVFAAGPLGLGLSSENAVHSLAAGGQAEAAGLRPGDLIVAVAGRDCRGAAHEEVLALVKASPRPLTAAT